MSQLYVVNDADGFICAFKLEAEAISFICEHGEHHRLYIMRFNDCESTHADDTIWFLPYRDIHVPAAVSSNVQYVKNIQLQLLRMNLVYADNVNFYMRKIGEVGPFEKHRLLLPDMDDEHDSDDECDECNDCDKCNNLSSPSPPPPPSTPITAPVILEQPQLIAEAITEAIRVSCKDYTTTEEHNHQVVESDYQAQSDTQDSS
jgi:hypothetical protein